VKFKSKIVSNLPIPIVLFPYTTAQQEGGARRSSSFIPSLLAYFLKLLLPKIIILYY
jgi:hypothetical protein